MQVYSKNIWIFALYVSHCVDFGTKQREAWHIALFPDFAIRIEHPVFQGFLKVVLEISVQFPEQEFMNAYNLNEYCVTYGSGDFGCNLNKILDQQIEVHDNKRLPYKLLCSTRSSSPEESRNNTREKIWYFFTRVSYCP